MRYSADDQHNIITKHSTQHYQLSAFSAIDYFQFEFNDAQYHNCWKLIQNSHSTSSYIPQSTNINRLENIIWRKWAKSRADLKECDPEEVNWYKESDITWLYGPLADSHKCESNFGFQSTVVNNNNHHHVPSTSFSHKDRRTESFSSLSSTSSTDSMASYNYEQDSESDIDSINESVFIDEEYEILSVKSILKHTSINGGLKFKEFKSFNKMPSIDVNISTPHKSVSFAEMVQIRQFY